jgi:glutathione peroxidase
MKSIACWLAIGAVTLISPVLAGEKSLYDVPLKDINGKATSLKAYEGKVLLIVNVASECGFTPQYQPLEATYKKYQDKGFVVLGFPSNDFGEQEPGTNEQIKKFCSEKYKVTFPLFDKVSVKNGPSQHPLYAALTGKDSPFPGDVEWNFGKFLVSRDGRIISRFVSEDEPDSEKVSKAIEAALASK